MKNIRVTLFICSLILLGAYKEAAPAYSVKKIVIDAGHGGHDSGALGSQSQEKEVTLATARELARIINENLPDVEVILSRGDDEFIGLKERADIANKNDADLFVSLHCNSSESSKAYGSESWVMGIHKNESNLQVAKRENAVILMEDDYEKKYEYDPNSPTSHILFSLYQNAYLENSLRLAHKIQTQFADRVGRHDRGVKQAGFVVLYMSSMPSVLVELGFISNPKEERYLNDKLGRVYMASAIYRAIKEYKKELE